MISDFVVNVIRFAFYIDMLQVFVVNLQVQ